MSINNHSKEDDIERLAAEALLQEAKRAAIRSSQIGPMGWKKCPLPQTNKRFLTNMILKTIEKNSHFDRSIPEKNENSKNISFKCKKKSTNEISKKKEKNYKPFHKKDQKKINVGSKQTDTSPSSLRSGKQTRQRAALLAQASFARRAGRNAHDRDSSTNECELPNFTTRRR